MFIRSNYNYITKVKINIGTLLVCETDEEAYIVLKELPTSEMLNLKKASNEGEEALMSFFKEAIPLILVDHNLMETEDKKMSKEDVAELIFEKLELTSKVMEEYSSKSFRTK